MSYIVPIGPYHPSLEEPVHARLITDGELISEYRTIKTDEQDEFYQVYEPDYNLLVLELWAMSKKFNSSNMPTYEL